MGQGTDIYKAPEIKEEHENFYAKGEDTQIE
jgi:hypothetical protein